MNRKVSIENYFDEILIIFSEQNDKRIYKNLYDLTVKKTEVEVDGMEVYAAVISEWMLGKDISDFPDLRMCI